MKTRYEMKAIASVTPCAKNHHRREKRERRLSAERSESSRLPLMSRRRKRVCFEDARLLRCSAPARSADDLLFHTLINAPAYFYHPPGASDPFFENAQQHQRSCFARCAAAPMLDAAHCVFYFAPKSARYAVAGCLPVILFICPIFPLILPDVT